MSARPLNTSTHHNILRLVNNFNLETKISLVHLNPEENAIDRNKVLLSEIYVRVCFCLNVRTRSENRRFHRVLH